MNLNQVVNVLANVVYTIDRLRVSLDRAFTFTCRRIKCSTRGLTREDMYNIAHSFVAHYYLVKRVVEAIRKSYSYRLLARAFLYIKSRELGLPIDSKLRKAIRRDLPGIEKVMNEVLAEEPWTRLSYPRWFYEKVLKVMDPEDAEKMLESMNRRVVWIRINTLKIDIDKALRIMEREGVFVEPDKRVPFLVRVIKARKPVRNLSLCRSGAAIIQDRASVLTVLALKPEPGMTIYDFAAAPGIKTSLIMQLTENRARVIAFDRSPRRLVNMRKLLKKYGVDIDRIDIALTDSRWIRMSRPCDAALVDAPCSSSGAIPKDPAIKMLLRSETIPLKMSSIQRSMLMNACMYADTVVYATCSIFPDEGEEVIAEVVNERGLEPVDPGIPVSRGYRIYDFWNRVGRTYPHIDECEGFFIARLER